MHLVQAKTEADELRATIARLEAAVAAAKASAVPAAAAETKSTGTHSRPGVFFCRRSGASAIVDCDVLCVCVCLFFPFSFFARVCCTCPCAAFGSEDADAQIQREASTPHMLQWLGMVKESFDGDYVDARHNHVRPMGKPERHELCAVM